MSSPGSEMPLWFLSTPDAQLREDGILLIDPSVAIAAVARHVKENERLKAEVRAGFAGLWRNVTEQFPAAVDAAVAVAIEGEPADIGARSGPRDEHRFLAAVKIERHPFCSARQQRHHFALLLGGGVGTGARDQLPAVPGARGGFAQAVWQAIRRAPG
jgi:hypothetical protein